ncbi:MAG: MATE family efflux transporter, partial [Chloroflexota bacterium]
MTTTQHPFIARPHRTLLALMFPVLLSLVAEPITGLVDTAFIAQLEETEPLAALGVATTALSSMFWVFNFLTVGTQTQISQAAGAGKSTNTQRLTSLALMVAWGLSIVVMIVFMPLAGGVSALLGAEGTVREASTAYIRIRLMGTPAVFTMLVCFGVMRGAQDMRMPSMIAVAQNVFNIILDYPFIFGIGDMIPGMGVAGAALASALSQYIGAAWALTVTLRRYGFTPQADIDGLRDLFQIGGNLFLRT